MIKIAIFTPKYSYNYVKKALDTKKDDCEKVYYFYKDLNELKELYSSVKNEVQAIITSGPIGYEVLKKNVEITTPVYYFEIQKYELYQNLLEIFLNNRDMEITRVYIDFIDVEDVKELVKSIKKTPIIKKFDYSDLNLYDNYKKIYKDLKEKNKVDFVFTRMSNITEVLEELKIPYKFIFPSEKSLNESLVNIVKDIKLNMHEEKRIVIGKINSKSEYKVLEKILKKKFKEFIIYESGNDIEIFTLKENLLKNIDELSKLHFEGIFIGWGGGESIAEVRYHAEQALKKHISLKGKVIIYIEKNKECILNNFSNKNKEDLAIYSLFQKMNIDKELGDQLVELFKKNENLSAEKLAINLQMSKRNASRILLKLENNKLAVSFFEKISRGRPTKMFRLKLNIT